MTFENKIAIALSAGLSLTGFLMCADATDKFHKVDRAVTKLGLAADRLDNMTHVDISDEVVAEHVNKAADKYAGIYAKRAAESVEDEAKAYIRGEVGKVVREKSSAIEKDVKEVISKKVACVDITDMLDEIRDEAKDALVDKLEGIAESEMKEMGADFKRAARAYGALNSLFKD